MERPVPGRFGRTAELRRHPKSVISYAKLKDFSLVLLRVEKYRVFDDKLVITAAERIS